MSGNKDITELMSQFMKTLADNREPESPEHTKDTFEQLLTVLTKKFAGDISIQEQPADSNGPVKTKAIDYSGPYYEKYAQEYLDFTYNNPTIYHVVSTVSKDLEAAGFKYLPESSSWTKAASTGGKFYTKRNGSSLVAFVVGADWTPQAGVGAIGSHIDALTVTVKPNSTKEKIDGYDLLGVAPYAGGLSNLWWDRDLGIGGRLLVKKSGKVVQTLVDSTPHPIAHVPTLAPHFGAPAQGPFNPETQAVPVVGFSGEEEEEEPATDAEKSAPLYGKHSLKLLRYIAKLAKVEVSDILQWDLQLFDVQKGVLGGLNKEFIFAPRIDDRICLFAAYKSLIEVDDHDLLSSKQFSVVGLFDNEEIGSATRQGIKGGLIELVVSRVISARYSDSLDNTQIQELIRLAYSNTIILSADVNHLVNPNFSSVYLEHHKPKPNKGITIALDPNGNMATDGVGLALVQELARKNDDHLQYFQIRNDSRSGGTIGPSISLQTGARTIDLGIPQLLMHLIRATAGAKDIGNGIKFFNGFFANWRGVYDSFTDL